MFEAIKSGRKKFELRREDGCKFNERDILVLKEQDSEKKFIGRELKKITFILRVKESNFWKRKDLEK